MNDTLKIVAYIVLVMCVTGFGYGFYHHYSRVTTPPSSAPATNDPAVASTDAPPAPRSGSYAAMMSYGAGLLAATVPLVLLLAITFPRFLPVALKSFSSTRMRRARRIRNTKKPNGYGPMETIWRPSN